MGPSRTGTCAFTPADVHRVAPSLDAGTIHVWWLAYRHAQGRAPLKSLLAAYLGTEPEAVSLVDGEHGRPALATPHAIDFNWSHSGGHALVAIARGLPELGVDIEQLRPRRRVLALAERFFADTEYSLLTALPVTQRNDAFIHLWTAKEAVLKAHGRGLAYGLERVVFTLDHARVVPKAFQGDVGEVGTWQLRALAPAPNLCGNLAWHGTARQVRLLAGRHDHQP